MVVNIEAVRMELYADVVRVDIEDPKVTFRAWHGDVCKVWSIYRSFFWGLDEQASTHLIVDAFRVQCGVLGV